MHAPGIAKPTILRAQNSANTFAPMGSRQQSHQLRQPAGCIPNPLLVALWLSHRLHALGRCPVTHHVVATAIAILHQLRNCVFAPIPYCVPYQLRQPAVHLADLQSTGHRSPPQYTSHRTAAALASRSAPRPSELGLQAEALSHRAVLVVLSYNFLGVRRDVLLGALGTPVAVHVQVIPAAKRVGSEQAWGQQRWISACSFTSWSWLR